LQVVFAQRWAAGSRRMLHCLWNGVLFAAVCSQKAALGSDVMRCSAFILVAEAAWSRTVFNKIDYNNSNRQN